MAPTGPRRLGRRGFDWRVNIRGSNMKPITRLSLNLFVLAAMGVSGCSFSPYPAAQTLRWPANYLWPSTRNHTDISRKPLEHSFVKSDLTEDETLTLMFCGDLMVQQGDHSRVMHPKLIALLDRADAIVANCEAALSPDRKSNPRRLYAFKFLMPPDYLKRFTAQVGRPRWLLSIANNHAADNGAAGVDATMATLTAMENVTPLGARPSQDTSPASTFTIDGVRFGIAAWTRWMNDVAGANSGEAPVMRESHAQIDWAAYKQREGVDVLIGYPHWEYEYQHFPHAETQEQARELLDSGIDLLVGSHPHVLQAMDWHQGKICAYSLGNFIGLGGRWPKTLTAVLEIKISARPESRGRILSYRVHPVARNCGNRQMGLLEDVPSGRRRSKMEKRVSLMYFDPEAPAP